MAESSEYTVGVRAAHEFIRNIKKLKKRYSSIRTDTEPAINEIRKGNFLGDRIAQTGYIIFKVRIKNRDIQKGKSAGYRLIYQAVSPTNVLLLKIYAKSDTSDISATEIKTIISESNE